MHVYLTVGHARREEEEAAPLAAQISAVESTPDALKPQEWAVIRHLIYLKILERESLRLR